MSDAHSRVSEQSELVALCGRAKLILEYESAELAEQKRRANRTWMRKFYGHIGWLRRLEKLLDAKEDRDLVRVQRVCPRWLHMLMPADTAVGGRLR